MTQAAIRAECASVMVIFGMAGITIPGRAPEQPEDGVAFGTGGIGMSTRQRESGCVVIKDGWFPT
jgi:hypothetical protein